jgi:hypothetical protein
MLALAMDWLLHELNQVLTDPQGAGPAVVGGNVAHLDAENADPPLTNKVVLSVVNLEEEKTLRNQPPYQESIQNGERTIEYRQPPAFLNAYLLFSASHVNYRNALRLLGDVVTFFQRRPVFTARNSPGFALPQNLADARLIVEFHSLGFEQVNHLWASLGGKQLPFVLYKCRLLKFEPTQAPLTRKPVLTVKPAAATGEFAQPRTAEQITEARSQSGGSDEQLAEFLEG